MRSDLLPVAASTARADAGQLRVAVPSDIAEPRELIEVSVRGLSTGVYSPAQVESSVVHVFGVESQLIADASYYVIVEGERIVAAGGWSARQNTVAIR